MRKRRLSDLTSSRAVLDAIAEYDRLGRDAFLNRYKYGKARRYLLSYGSRHYDSKAIVGAAYGFQFPAVGPLQSDEFTGGKVSVQAKLEELGFTVAVLPVAALSQRDDRLDRFGDWHYSTVRIEFSPPLPTGDSRDPPDAVDLKSSVHGQTPDRE